MRVVVLGVGNILLSDEGVGVRAVEALRQDYELPPQVEAIDGGTSAMELLDELAHADRLIVLDAVHAGQPPATLVQVVGAQVPVFFRSRLSPHQVGLSDVLAVLDLMGESPGETVIYGVEPVSLQTRMELSAPVGRQVQELVGLVVKDLRALGLAVPQRACAAA